MRTKILILCTIVIAFFGCATMQPKDDGQTSVKSVARMQKIGHSVYKCLPVSLTLKISHTDNLEAYTNGNDIIFSRGMFQFNDSVLTFVMAHEMSHAKLNHVRKAQAVSLMTTGAMLIANLFVPGVGLLNHAVNPAIVNNYSKEQEIEADASAAKVCLCIGMTPDEIIAVMQAFKNRTKDGGGFWDNHPAWDDRIANVEKTLHH